MVFDIERMTLLSGKTLGEDVEIQSVDFISYGFKKISSNGQTVSP